MTDNKKYYLAYLFSPYSAELHCTHCYFGTLNVEDVEFIIRMVDVFFEVGIKTPLTMKSVPFTIPAWFGPDNSIRVLLAPDRDEFRSMATLREFFVQNEFIQSEHPFRPHVATDRLIRIDLPFHSYALVSGNTLIKTWPIHGV